MDNRDQDRQSPPKKRKWVLWLIAVLALAVIGLGVWYYIYESQKNKSQFGSRDVNALKGNVSLLSDEEILKELNQIVDENSFNISIASQVAVYGSPQTAELRIENKVINRYLMQVDVLLDETAQEGGAEAAAQQENEKDRLVYKSGIIEPGYYIPAAELLRPLDPGEYPATAVFTALYADNEAEVGKVAAKIQLFVLRQGETPAPVEPTPMPSPTPTPLPEPSGEEGTLEPGASPEATPAPSPTPRRR
jgi:hypothetical protein